MSLFNFLKKKPNEEITPVAPNLMAADPATNGNVNLMAADPINSAPVMQKEELVPEITEQPGIETQITIEAPTGAGVNIPQGVPTSPLTETPPKEVPSGAEPSALDAFAMSVPSPVQPAPVVPSNPLMSEINEPPTSVMPENMAAMAESIVPPNLEQNIPSPPDTSFVITEDSALTAPSLPSNDLASSLGNAPISNNKFCSECGTPNDLLNKFCVSCGKPIE